MEKSESAEVKKRAAGLLAELEKARPSPEDRRALRAVETLEAIATPEAARLLSRLAGDEPSSPLTRAAEGAVKRLAAP